jgi:hypothetical protein
MPTSPQRLDEGLRAAAEVEVADEGVVVDEAEVVEGVEEGCGGRFVEGSLLLIHPNSSYGLTLCAYEAGWQMERGCATR